ncbi:MAG: NUDIX domain-containing protein, partial [Planctomycetota bacterium]|jgi:ADP-ribose pyrophosphatase YjhB (NUDIX family)
MFLRNAAKAIIVEDGRLLALKCRARAGLYYILPGGGQQPGETLVEALVREVREEVGAEVSVGGLAHVREYIARNHEFADQEPDVHSIEFCFECRLEGRPDVERQTAPDQTQIGFEWLELDRLASYPFWPRALIPILTGGRREAPVYLGDVN